MVTQFIIFAKEMFINRKVNVIIMYIIMIKLCLLCYIISVC